MRTQYDLPIHRLMGHNIDISLIWHLFLDANDTVILNGVKTIFYCPHNEYLELEKHYYAYRGQNIYRSKLNDS